ncbi:MAG: hypothetical protein ACRER2_01100 [Methylococcales bacterium]
MTESWIVKSDIGTSALKKRDWPEWWDWEIELTPHLLKRMEDRNFNEVDLREMLQRSQRYK